MLLLNTIEMTNCLICGCHTDKKDVCNTCRIFIELYSEMTRHTYDISKVHFKNQLKDFKEFLKYFNSIPVESRALFYKTGSTEEIINFR